MKILIIGGTGIISTAVSRAMIQAGHELWLINRGHNNHRLPDGAHVITADIGDPTAEAALLEALNDTTVSGPFDCAADFIVQQPTQIERDYRLLNGKTRQYILISSASAYQKPLSHYVITESTPLSNPYWEYSRNKIACEDALTRLYRETGFPMTIIRPSHTYDEYNVPLCMTGYYGSYAVIKRMLAGKPVIIPGDGTSLWTLTHNSDFAAAFLGLAGNPQAIGEAVNVTSDEVMTWNQIYRTIADALNVELKPFYVSSMFLHEAGPYDFKCCLIGERVETAVFKNDKLKRMVPGFIPQMPFREGIRVTLAHLLQDESLHTEDPIFDHWCDSLIQTLTDAAQSLSSAYPHYN